MIFHNRFFFQTTAVIAQEKDATTTINTTSEQGYTGQQAYTNRCNHNNESGTNESDKNEVPITKSDTPSEFYTRVDEDGQSYHLVQNFETNGNDFIVVSAAPPPPEIEAPGIEPPDIEAPNNRPPDIESPVNGPPDIEPLDLVEDVSGCRVGVSYCLKHQIR